MTDFNSSENVNENFGFAGGRWGGHWREGAEDGPWSRRGPRGRFGYGRHDRDEERNGHDGPWGGPWGRGPFGGPRFRGFGVWRFASGFPYGPSFGAWGFGPGFVPDGPEGPGGPGFGPGGPGFGPGGRGPRGPRRGPGPRMFGRGDLKYALLDLLQERPKHGYEMIKDLEDRTGGFYTPSPGAVYPTLQLLEDRGWVSVETREGRKVYTITDAGRDALREQRERFGDEGPFGPRGPWGGPGEREGRERHEHREHHGRHEHHGHHEHEHEHHGRHEHEGPFGRGRGPFGPMDRETRQQLRELARQSRDVMFLMRRAVFASGGDAERLARLRGIVEQTHANLETYLKEMPSEPGQGRSGKSGEETPPEII